VAILPRIRTGCQFSCLGIWIVFVVLALLHGLLINRLRRFAVLKRINALLVAQARVGAAK